MSSVPTPRGRGPVARVVRRLEAVPLRTRLVAIVGTLVGAALLLTSLATAVLMRSDLMDGVDAELRSVARPVASQALADLSSRDNTVPSNYAFELQSQFGDATRLPTGVTAKPELPELSTTDPLVISGEPFTVPSESGPLKWRFVAGRVTGANATFAVGIPLSTVNHTVTRLLVTTAVIGTLALIGSLVLAWYAVRRAFRPLSRIEDTAAAIATGDLTQRIPVRQADDEVTSLSRSLNVMLTRIESSFSVREASEERMRQFVADASHELRTPLATVRGYAELYRQGAVPDSAAVGQAMERIEAESTRMSGLVEDLLTLARIDDAPVVAMTSVDLTVLAADAVADARVRAPERRISLLGLDPLHRGADGFGVGDGSLAVQLGVPAHRRQRGAQLMGGVGDELAHPLLAGLADGEGRLDPGEHRVEAAREGGDLVVGAAHRHPLGEVTRGDRGRGVLDAREGPEGAAHGIRREHDGQDEHDGADEAREDEQPGHGVVHGGQRLPDGEGRVLAGHPAGDEPPLRPAALGRHGERLAARDAGVVDRQVGQDGCRGLAGGQAQDRPDVALQLEGVARRQGRARGAEVAQGLAGHGFGDRAQPVVDLVEEVGAHEVRRGQAREHQGRPDEGAHDGDEAPPQGQRLESPDDAAGRTGAGARCGALRHQP